MLNVVVNRLNDWGSYGYSQETWESLTNKQRYVIRHPDRIKESQKKAYHSNIEYIKKRQRNYWIKANYNLTENEYIKMLSEQDNKCAICKTENISYKGHTRFCVDHCHTSGKVRGLLCSHCNTGIGHLKDDINLLKEAIKYLERNNE